MQTLGLFHQFRLAKALGPVVQALQDEVSAPVLVFFSASDGSALNSGSCTQSTNLDQRPGR